MNSIHSNISQQTHETKIELRNRVETIKNRVCILSGIDKLVMLMHIDNGISIRTIAKLAGINEMKLSRRIRKLSKRLTDSRYLTCLRYRSKFSDDELALAKQYFIDGLSIRQIACRQNRTYYKVREKIKQIKQIIEAIEMLEGHKAGSLL